MKGLSQATEERIIGTRQMADFVSLADFLQRVNPSARERRLMANAGALNDLPGVNHRRDALWQSELPLYDDLLQVSGIMQSVLPAMTISERLAADFATQGASTGPHPMKLWRERDRMNLQRARDLHILPHGIPVVVGGMVICLVLLHFMMKPIARRIRRMVALEPETASPPAGQDERV